MANTGPSLIHHVCDFANVQKNEKKQIVRLKKIKIFIFSSVHRSLQPPEHPIHRTLGAVAATFWSFGHATYATSQHD